MAELIAADYAFLIILKAEGRELDNNEMDDLYQVRLKGPTYAKLNADGYVSSDTKNRPYKHVITAKGLKALASPLTIDEDRAGQKERRSLREKQLWAALVAQQNEIVRLLAKGNGSAASAASPAEPPADLDGRIRAAYAELAGGPGEWVDLAALRPLFHDVSKSELDRALVRMLDARDVRLEPDSLKHRVGADGHDAAVHVGGEDRHKLAIGRR